MKQTRLLMGMPITLNVVDTNVTRDDLEEIFQYFLHIDEMFSTYKEDSEISRFNRGELDMTQLSVEMQTILALSEQTKQETHGYFDVQHAGTCDPSGIVKGWAIQNAAKLLSERGFHHFYIDAGGDIQVAGTNQRELWRIGIRNPFKREENVKVLALTDCGVATSGTAIRSQHIYNPHHPTTPLQEVVSLTVIGPNIYEADRFATAAFAMGRKGMYFLEKLVGFEGYLIDAQARAMLTSGFERYVFRA